MRALREGSHAECRQGWLVVEIVSNPAWLRQQSSNHKCNKSSEGLEALGKSGKICGPKAKRLWGIACPLRACFLLSEKKGLEVLRSAAWEGGRPMRICYPKSGKTNKRPHTSETVTAQAGVVHAQVTMWGGWDEGRPGAVGLELSPEGTSGVTIGRRKSLA